MAGEVERAGQGFLTASGELKDKKALASEDAARSAKNQSTNSSESDRSQQSSSSEFSEDSVRSAFRSVRNRFTEDINSVASVVNESDDTLKKADTNLKAQIDTAKELKTALDENDSETAAVKREQLAKLQDEQDQIARKAEEDNVRRTADRRQTIALGNKQRAVIDVKKVEVKESDRNQDLESKDGVNELIKNLKADRDEIKTQRSDLKEVKKEIKEVAKSVRNEIGGVEKSVLNSLSDAEKTASQIASSISKVGSQATLVSKIDESTVKALVEG